MPFYKILLAVFVMMIIGLSAVVSKIGLAEFPPMLFLLLRFCVVAPALLFIPKPRISWPMLIAITATLSVGHLLLVNLGLSLGASPGIFAILLQTGTLFAILSAYFLFQHRPTRYEIIGIAIGMIGIYWICATRRLETDLWAVLALIGAAAAWGLGYTLVKKAHAPSVPTMAWTSILAIPCMAIICALFEGKEMILSSIANASLTAWSTVFFAGWVSMMGAGSILMYLMRTEKVSKVVPYNMLIPVFGCLASTIILNEKITQNMIVGGILIVFSFLITQFGQEIVSKSKLKYSELVQ